MAPLEMPQSTAAEQQPDARLDVTLEYTIRFLEGDHKKSSLISQSILTSVLEEIKTTMKWKEQPRAPHEIIERIDSLNGLMMETVSSL